MGYTPPFLDVRKVAGGWSAYAPSTTTGDDLTIYANTTDVTPYVKLNGASYLDLATPTGVETRFYSATTQYLLIGYNVAQNYVYFSNPLDAKDLYLATTGTGLLRFGTYTAGAATDSTGYITIKDAAGNTRKLMVQA